MTKIFISYRRDDSAVIAGRIYDYLIPPLGPFAPEMVFKDVDSIPLGVNFKRHLESKIAECALCLVIIGPNWVNARDERGNIRLHDPGDFVRIEVEAALQRGIPVIPLLVMGANPPAVADLPSTLAELVYQNGTPIGNDPHFKTDMGRVVRSLEQWLNPSAQPAPVVIPTPAIPTTPFALPLLEWIDIPAGRVTLEKDKGTHEVAPFKIAKYPVTNAQFDAFINDNGYITDKWWEGLIKRETVPEQGNWQEPDCPRETVNWYEAMAFTRWLSAKTGLAITLPTEMQWKWAAIKDTEWAYPYGKNFDKNKCNTRESGIGRTTPVTKYPNGTSPFGVMEMSGNVFEWCLNQYDNLDTAIRSEASRVVRGGSWDSFPGLARAAYRFFYSPDFRGNFIGLRLVYVGPPSP
jgi:formylglycine-generating enzyme required for sulfatase activity